MLTKRVANSALVTGDVVITRSERGNVTATHVVQEVSRCTADPSNRHIAARDRKTNNTANWCMYDNSESEITA